MSGMQTKKARILDPEMLYDMLLSARTADRATLLFKDGRVLIGSLVFNQFKGTGRVIDVDREMSIDFAIDELRDVQF